MLGLVVWCLTAPPAVSASDSHARQLLARGWNGLRVSGSDLVDSKGHVVKLKGVNWFGFNNKQTAPDGLWAG